MNMNRFPNLENEIPSWVRVAGMLMIAAIWLVACSGIRPGEDPQSPSADSVRESDPDQYYPVRLYLDAAGVSILPPPEWEVQETATVEEPLDIWK